MKKLMFAAVAAMACAGAFGDTYWRWASNATADTPTWTEVETAVFTMPSFTGATADDNVVEFLQDCTFGADIAVGVPVTLCSQSDEVKVLSRTASVLFDVSSRLVIKNLVLDGGAKWAEADTLSSLTQLTGGVSGRGLCNLAADGAEFVLGSGGVIRNCHTTSAASLPYGMVGGNGKDATVRMLDGSLITDCRGQRPMISFLDKGVFRMEGGEITRCYCEKVGFDICGIVNFWGGTAYFSGGLIHGNVVKERGAVFCDRPAARYFLSGTIRIEDNTLPNGALANVYANSSANVVMDGKLEDSASVGVTLTGAMEEGAVFGSAASAEIEGAERFFNDANPYELAGALAEGNLVWRRMELQDIVYSSAARTYEFDGADKMPDLQVETPGVTVEWANSKAGPFSDRPSGTSAVGLHCLWFRLTKSGYRTVVASQLVSVSDGSVAGWRASVDGGQSWAEGNGTSLTMPNLSMSDPAAGIVELLTDCTYSSRQDILGALTLRSRTGEVHALRRTADVGFSLDGKLVLSDIVIDGAADWTNPDDLSSLSAGTLKTGSDGFCNLLAGAELVLGAGCVVSNYLANGNGRPWGVVGTSANAGCTIRMLDGARIVDCRGARAVVSLVNNGTFRMEGGEITRCYSSGEGQPIYGVISMWGSAKTYLSGGAIRGNLTTFNGAVFPYNGNACVYVSGDPVVTGNKLTSGAVADVYVLNDESLKQDGDMTEGASVGVIYANHMQEGDAFGKLTDAVWTGSDGFFNDQNPDVLVGWNSSGNLVWRKLEMQEIDYTVAAADFEAGDGLVHLPSVTVTTPGVTVEWAMSKSGPFSSTPPEVPVGLSVIWCRLSKAGYFTVLVGQPVAVRQPGEETGWRMSCDGGASWARIGGTRITLPAFAVTDNVRSEIELLADCTYDTAVAFNQPLTLRSAAGERRTLQRTAGVCWTDSSELVVSNLVVDGGLRWANADDVADTTRRADSLVDSTTCFCSVDRDSSITLGEGAEIVNFYQSGEPYGLIGAGSSGARIAMLAGSRIADCRGKTAVVFVQSGATFELSGTIERCANLGTLVKGIVVAWNTSTGTIKGGRISGNVSLDMPAATIRADQGLRLEGDVRIFGNALTDGTAADVNAVGADATYPIVLAGALAPTARIGVWGEGRIGPRVKFGTASDEASGANAFFADGRGLVGRIKNGELAWATGLVLIVR